MYTIKQNASLHAIASMFDDMGRRDNFSLQGIEAILDYLEEVAVNDSAGHCKAIEVDVIAICCDFTESSYEDVVADYSLESGKGFDFDNGDLGEILVEVREHTWAVPLDNGNILYLNF